MAKKQDPAVLGYNGQPPTYLLNDGREVSAGDATVGAARQFADWTEGEVEAWNSLDDEARRKGVEEWIAQQNDVIETNALDNDAKARLASVGSTAERQLGADLVAATLEQIKTLPRPWQAMTHDQQQDVLDSLTNGIRAAVGTTIRTLATYNHPHIVCTLEQINIKSGAKAVLALPNAAVDEAMVDAVGQSVILIVDSGAEIPQGIQTPEAEADQGDLLDQVIGTMGGEDDGTSVQHSDPED